MLQLFQGFSSVTRGEVKFTLNFFDKRYEFFTDSAMSSAVTSHYRFQIIQQTYKIMFGLDLVGNPHKIVVDMFSGVKDFFYEPYHGLTQSGDEFLEGLEFGTKKMFSGIVGGTTGGLSKITHSLGSVTAGLTFDTQYQDRRAQDSANTVKGVKEGFSRAGEKLVGGVVGGLFGLAAQPVKATIINHNPSLYYSAILFIIKVSKF